MIKTQSLQRFDMFATQAHVSCQGKSISLTSDRLLALKRWK